MNILVNQNANSGKSKNAIEKALRGELSATENKIYKKQNTKDIARWCEENLNDKNYFFTAIGGDGTLNLLLNNIMVLKEKDSHLNDKITLGSVGVGSSNDAHKPFTNKERPYLNTDINKAKRVDIGSVQFKQKDLLFKKYFLLNSSVGITSNANFEFNAPGFFIKLIKKLSTNLAINVIALKNLIKNKKIPLELSMNGKVHNLTVNNLSIIKRPYFAGSFHYKDSPELDNGLFKIHISSNLNHFGILKTAYELLFGRFKADDKHKSYETSEITVISKNESFNLEIDGEVYSTTEATWTVCPKAIKVIC